MIVVIMERHGALSIEHGEIVGSSAVRVGDRVWPFISATVRLYRNSRGPLFLWEPCVLVRGWELQKVERPDLRTLARDVREDSAVVALFGWRWQFWAIGVVAVIDILLALGIYVL